MPVRPVIGAVLSLRAPAFAQAAGQLFECLLALFEKKAGAFAREALAEVLPCDAPVAMAVFKAAQE